MHLSPEWIQLGTVQKTYGIHGTVILKFLNQSHACNIMRPGFDILFVFPNGKRIEIIKSLIGRKLSILDINSKTKAELLVGMDFFFRRLNFPDPLTDEIYLIDLIGFRVININDNTDLLFVIGFSDNNAQLLVEIENKNKKKFLVPFVKPVLKNINETNKEIVMDFPTELVFI